MRRIPKVMQKGKFSKQWEGLHEIKEVLRMYKLINLSNRKEGSRAWNAIFLIFFLIFDVNFLGKLYSFPIFHFCSIGFSANSFFNEVVIVDNSSQPLCILFKD